MSIAVDPSPAHSRADDPVPPPGAGGTPPVPEGYRPHLDGLRAVAVYLVVAYHAGIGWFGGGFIGVDVFFVLSGYLVTQVLLRDLAGEGRVRFGRFYARRMRRLLPASALALLGTAVAFSWVASPVEVAESVGAFRASFLYVANWYFVGESTDYFAASLESSPVLHFWSLAVEEQFYLAWPLVLTALVAAARRVDDRGWAVVRAAVALAALASFGWAWHLADRAPAHAYYGTDTRAYQLLAGALVAMSPMVVARLRRVDRFVAPAAVAALAGLVVVATDLGPDRPVERGLAATVLTVVLLVSLEHRGGSVRSLLGLRPVVELGRISYGTYLWHWPVIVVVGRLVDLDPWRMLAVATVVSSGLAALSALLVELPVRHSGRLDRAPRAVVVGGVAVSLLFGLVVVEPLAEASRPERPVGSVALPEAPVGELTPVPADFDQEAIWRERYAIETGCRPETGEGCTLVEGDGAHVLLIGDSNAQMLQGPLRDLAEAEGLTLTVAAEPGCPWQEGFVYESHVEKQDLCARIHDRVYDSLLDELEPDLVVAANVREWSTFSRPDFGDRAQDASLRSTTRRSAQRIVDAGARLVVVEPFPRGPRDPNPLNCLGTATYQEECRFSSPTEPYWVERDLRALDQADDDVFSIDLDRAVCPSLPLCDPIVDGVVVFWDDAHLTVRYGLTLADDIAAVWRERGLLDP